MRLPVVKVNHFNFGEIFMPVQFYGRVGEVSKLHHFLQNQHCEIYHLTATLLTHLSFKEKAANLLTFFLFGTLMPGILQTRMRAEMKRWHVFLPAVWTWFQ